MPETSKQQSQKISATTLQTGADPARVERAIQEIRAGRMVILVDDVDRENEGDLTMAAELVTPEAINFMATHGRGLICVTLTKERVEALQLPPMVGQNTSSYGTAFTVSIEAREGVTTGISASDRAKTILTSVHDSTHPEDLVRPGHVFPLQAQPGGVLVRTGQTEGSVDLARLAGLKPAGVICEVMRDDGSMARMPDLEKFGAEHDIMVVSVADIVAYRLAHESLVEQVVTTTVDTDYGEFEASVFRSAVDDVEVMVLYKGALSESEAPLVRVHSGCVYGDAFPGMLCQCGLKLRGSLKAIADAGCGALLYLPPDAERPNLAESLKRVAKSRAESTGLPERPIRNVASGSSANLRHYGLGAQVLHSLGLRNIRLLSNRDVKLTSISGFGLTVVDLVPIPDVKNQDFRGEK